MKKTGTPRKFTAKAVFDMLEAIRPRAVLVIGVGEKRFYAHLEDNSSARTFTEKLNSEPLILTMQDCGGVEKAGELPWELPADDRQITAAPGDLLLCGGNRIALCYGENTRSLTRLARIGSTGREKLPAALGEGEARVEFYLEWSE